MHTQNTHTEHTHRTHTQNTHTEHTHRTHTEHTQITHKSHTNHTQITHKSHINHTPTTPLAAMPREDGKQPRRKFKFTEIKNEAADWSTDSDATPDRERRRSRSRSRERERERDGKRRRSRSPTRDRDVRPPPKAEPRPELQDTALHLDKIISRLGGGVGIGPMAIVSSRISLTSSCAPPAPAPWTT